MNNAYLSKKWLYKKYCVEKWTQQKIAEYCGVSQKTISLWIKNFGLKR